MKALRRCRNNLEADNVVLIDVDTYDFHNVIDLDLLESLTNKRRGPSGLKNDKNTPPRTYIYIDDDESPRERNHENGASSSNISPLKLSKGKRTYGLQSDDDDDDDDDDDEDENFDCELMEDFSGKLRAEWERAFLKRKGDLFSNNVNQNKQKHGQECSFNGTHNENKQNHGQDSSFNGTHNEKRGKSHVGSDNDYEDGIPCGESSFLNHDDGDMPGGKTFVCEDECGERDEMCEEIPCSSNQEKDGKDDVVNDDIIDDVSVEDSIIDQREKLKETEEYKRALEEELSARQIALKIQAEEAQQLRRIQKRKKAESLRLLDMERRQKQRVEEIRETQKKDEENMNLKEQYRTEVREELKKLEFMCRDMASLLRGLGIQVGDGPCPLSHEVRAAYKRALLSFHPDRASGSDMRQQVEAEEKFKLISRMKEKLSV